MSIVFATLWALNVVACTITSLIELRRNNTSAVWGWGLAALYAFSHFYNNLFKIITGV